MMDWQQIKHWVNNNKFSSVGSGFSLTEAGESHELTEERKVKHHNLLHYRADKVVDGWPIQMEYTYCPDCKKQYWKRTVVSNDAENCVYQKWWQYPGKEEHLFYSAEATDSMVMDF